MRTSTTSSMCLTVLIVQKDILAKHQKRRQTRVTEHQNAINRHDHNSFPAKHADDNGSILTATPSTATCKLSH